MTFMFKTKCMQQEWETDCQTKYLCNSAASLFMYQLALCLTMLWQTSFYWSRTFTRKTLRLEQLGFKLDISKIKYCFEPCNYGCQWPCVWRCCGRHRASCQWPSCLRQNACSKNEKPTVNPSILATLQLHCTCVNLPCVWRCCGRHSSTGRGPSRERRCIRNSWILNSTPQ